MKDRKYSCIKKGIFLGITAFLTAVCAGCGSKESDEGRKETGTEAADEYVYVPEYYALDLGADTSIGRLKIYGDDLYYTSYTYDESIGQTQNALVYRSLSEPDTAEMLDLDADVPEGFSSNLGDFALDKEGNLFCIRHLSPIYEEGKEYSEGDYKTYLVKYSAGREKVWSVDLAEVFTEENRYVQNLALGGEGKIYLSSNNIIYVMDGSGNYLKTIQTDAEWINSMTSTEDGRVYTVQYGNHGMEVAQVDTVKDVMGETRQGIPDTNNDIRTGLNGALLVSGFSKLYEYDPDTGEASEVLDWTECNIHGNSVRDAAYLEDGRLVVFCDDYEGETELVFLTKTDSSELLQKKILTIATLYESSSSLQEAVVDFNKSHPEYTLKIRSYMDETAEWTENAYSDALTRFRADILSDNCPDLIDLSTVNLKHLTAKGVLEDLTPYLKSSKEANMEDFVPSVLDAYNVDGIQTTVPTYFTVSTLLGRSSVVGDEPGWTIEEMIVLAKANPDAKLMHGMTKENALQACLTYANDSFIDYKNSTCSFDCPEFVKILEFADCFDDEYEYNEDESFPKMLQSGQVLLSDAYFSDVHAYQMYYLMFEEDGVIPIGYPTSDGTPGVFLSGNEIYGISARSENKDAAWKFLESVLSGQSASHAWGFPSRKDQLEEMFDEACEPEYQYDANGEIVKDQEGNPVEIPKTSWGYDNWNVDIYAADQEVIDGLRSLIEIAGPLTPESEEIYEIIREEAAPYFAGRKSAQETAKIIQSRVQMYVSENN